MCTQFNYKCYYEKHSRKRSKIVEQSAEHDLKTDFFVHHEPSTEDRPSIEDVAKMRSMEANSGIAFTRLLGQRLDPSSGPKLFTFGWNLGAGLNRTPTTSHAPISDLLGQDQMYAMARLYFENVHPLYGFLDQEWVMEQLNIRWAQPDLCKAPDHFFANIAAVGSQFSDGSIQPIIPSIVDSAKRALESTSLMLPPILTDVQSWVLRALYLRSTDHPHAVHMCSCIALHLVEALGLHQEANSSALHPAVGSDQLHDAEIRRRTFWIARMMNTWVSFEYGRTRVALRGITAELPTPRKGDYTTDYINLYSLSCCLDPERDNSKWEEFLRQLENYEARHDGIELSKANLGMCGYRRLRLANPNLSSDTINRIIKIGLNGLEAARRMAEKGMPWWHVANVPFQVVCVFLAMDVRDSLMHIATAIRVLEDVVERFQTIAMKEALKTARFLVRLSKKRKDEDSEVLGLSLKKVLDAAADGDPQPENLQPKPAAVVDGKGSNGFAIPSLGHPSTAGSISSEDWSLDVMNDTDFDWNFFLTADMPAFNGFAPDGTM
ncbi:hypothetical protein LTR37_011028 [Vermiconidia calcicola]|uniref:Uncharacterized protein n=1 Tax=Vermiconidia calcicola TaxID=1690605 RepID=A0ACC3N4K1_9PEZI|nr:hypothetical protein LTR37_011028 [Vermiconidia calcicola]